jgi:hypothetical protein
MAFLMNGRNAAVNGVAGSSGFLAAHQAYPGTTGATELSGGSPAYARVAATWGAAASGVRTLTSTNSINVPLNSDVQFYSSWDAATAGNCQAVFAVNGADQEYQIDVTNDLVLAEAHGLAAGDQVAFMALGLAGGVPGGLTEGTLYFVIATGLTTDAFKIAATAGGAAINITSKGDAGAVVSKVVPEHYNAQGTTTPTSLTLAVK